MIRTTKQVSQATKEDLQAHLASNTYYRGETTFGELRHNYLLDQVRSELRDIELKEQNWLDTGHYGYLR